ncbi:MAG: hypothetical protein ACRDTG_04285 [Pseudonocardiaceae bacterium]
MRKPTFCNHYAKEFLNARHKNPTPYMEKLHFGPSNGAAADPDSAVLSDQELEQAIKEGEDSTG